MCGIFKCFRSHIFIAQGCEDSDMCGDSDTCAESELNNLVLHNNAHPCAMTPICAILTKTKGACVGCFERTPLCEDSDMCDPNQTTADIAALAVHRMAATRHN